eukprot:scaffold140494_cov20-Tisochrysis_lutea.AAC.2
MSEYTIKQGGMLVRDHGALACCDLWATVLYLAALVPAKCAQCIGCSAVACVPTLFDFIAFACAHHAMPMCLLACQPLFKHAAAYSFLLQGAQLRPGRHPV